MNKLDEQYIILLQDIIDNGTEKVTRNGGTKSVFGRQIRHNMSEGFPLLTTKKMPFKTIATELLWFLNGETNIKWLLDRGCNIWNGDAYKNYLTKFKTLKPKWDYGTKQCYATQEKWGTIHSDGAIDGGYPWTVPFTQKVFIEMIKTDDDFAKKWGDLGPIYGKQWRKWGEQGNVYSKYNDYVKGIDQIKELIENLKNNPDSRRLKVSAWNVAELKRMVLPPCHYGFQVYTRELSEKERVTLLMENIAAPFTTNSFQRKCDEYNIPKRAISLMWNQRSVDTFLGLPFNIASYGLLLEIIAKEVNMVPDELIANLGDTHLYLNHVDQAIVQMGSEITDKQLNKILREYDEEAFDTFINAKKLKAEAVKNQNYEEAAWQRDKEKEAKKKLAEIDLPLHDRVPFELPILKIKGYTDDGMIKPKLLPEEGDEAFYEVSDFLLEGYKSHPPIKAPLSN